MILVLEYSGFTFPLIPKIYQQPFIWHHNDVLMMSESQKKKWILLIFVENKLSSKYAILKGYFYEKKWLF